MTPVKKEQRIGMLRCDTAEYPRRLIHAALILISVMQSLSVTGYAILPVTRNAMFTCDW